MLPLLLSSSRCSVDFSYTDSNRTLVISGDGEFTADDITKIFGKYKNFTHLQIYGAITTIPDLAFNGSINLTDIEIKAPITKIGIQSFSYCSALNSFTIPETIDSIGGSCFLSCTNLKSVQYHVHTMTFGGSAFQGCKNMVSFTQVANDTSKPIEGMTHSFGGSCFQGCASLSTLELPPNTATLGDCVFQGCTGLTSFNSTSGLTVLPKWAFKGCNKLHKINIPDVEIIGIGSFEDCSGLSEFIFENLKLIKMYAFKNCRFNSIPLESFDFKMEGYAFYQCNNLKSFSMPPSMDVVPEFAFYGCGSLDTITYRGNIKTIKNSAFRQTNILTFEIPKTCESIEPFVFAEMNRVNGFTIPAENKFFSYDANQKLLYNYNRTKLIHSIWTSSASNLVFDENLTSIEDWPFTDSHVHTNYTMPKALVSLGEAVFRKNTKLTVLAFPPNLEKIPARCCYQCESLTTVYLGNVKVIGPQAFSFCTKLTSIVLPQTLEVIECYAFAQCNSLTSIQFPSKIKEIQFGAFYQCHLENVSVPNTIKFIPRTVFAKNSNLKSIQFNGALTELRSAFFDDNNLQEISLLQNVDYIPIDAFWYTPNLTTVVYCGDKAVNGAALLNHSSTTQVFTGDSYKSDTFAGIKVSKDPTRCAHLRLTDQLYVDGMKNRSTIVLIVTATAAAVIVAVAFLALFIKKILTKESGYTEIK